MSIMLLGTVQNMIISSVLVFIVSLIMLVNPGSAFIVLIGCISVDMIVVGVMYVLGMSLNTLTSIIITMAIGFSYVCMWNMSSYLELIA